MTYHIKQAFTESIQTKIEAADTLSGVIERASSLMVNTLIDGGRIFCCGGDGSAFESRYFANEMLNRYSRERPSLPVIALNSDISSICAADAQDLAVEIYARQLRAMGGRDDVLLIFSHHGFGTNVIKALEAALSRDMLIVAITGGDGGKIAGFIGSNDIEIRVPSNDVSRIKEVQLLVIHCLRDAIDNSLFGVQ